MVDISVNDSRVAFEVRGADKLWSLRSRIEIPLEHITNIEHDPENVGRWWHGFKMIGTDLPGLFAMGTFYYHGELVFWDVHDIKKTIVVSLEHEHYKKLIVEVADPDDAVARIRTALKPRAPL